MKETAITRMCGKTKQVHLNWEAGACLSVATRTHAQYTYTQYVHTHTHTYNIYTHTHTHTDHSHQLLPVPQAHRKVKQTKFFPLSYLFQFFFLHKYIISFTSVDLLMTSRLSRYCDSANEVTEGSFWPIVKQVRVWGPWEVSWGGEWDGVEWASVGTRKGWGFFR